MKSYGNISTDISTIVAALILCCLSLALPVYQWASIPDQLLLQVLAGAAALALGICKLTFIPLAVDNYEEGKRFPAVCLLLIAVLALAISVSASRDLLNNATLTKQQAGTVNSYAFKNAQTELNDLNAEIQTLNGLLAKDLAANFRDRAYIKRKGLKVLRSDRSLAAKKVERLSRAPLDLPGATFGKNITFGPARFAVSIQAATGAALVLHLACIFAVLAVTAWKPERNLPNSNPGQNKRLKKDGATSSAIRSSRANGETRNADKKTVSIKTLTADQKRLSEEIVAGLFGDAPALRDLIARKSIKGGYKKISPVFNYLVEQNKLVMLGNRFSLVQKTITSDL